MCCGDGALDCEDLGDLGSSPDSNVIQVTESNSFSSLDLVASFGK